MKPAWVLAAIGAVVVAVLAGTLLHALAPWPRAEVASGSEEAFVRGLYPREVLAGGGLRRWTTSWTRVCFRNVPAGESTLEVRLRGHRGPVGVAVDGVWVGALAASESARRFTLAFKAEGRRDVDLALPVFRAGDGRDLGALFESVSLEHPCTRRPPWALLGSFVGLALVTTMVALLCGFGPGVALLLGTVSVGLQALLLWPSGLVRSPYALTLSCLLLLGVLASGAFSLWCRRRLGGTGLPSFVSVLGAWVVLVVLGTSPLMVVSDAVFHAHHLERVARGELFPVSVTQHAHPFRFPYGVSFYALLAPLQRAGIDAVVLVRAGAALSALVASLGFFTLLARSAPMAAALSVAVLQLQPVSFDVLSHGNLSNVFGQSLTLLFFVWWAGKAGFGWPTGALLLALSCLAHFSSFLVLLVLSALLVFVGRGSLGRDFTRRAALVVGLAVALLYYGRFATMVLDQLPRLLEGGSRHGPTGGAWSAPWRELREAARGWGVPAILLALLGRPRLAQGRPEQDLVAYWLAGSVLAAAAVVSPLDVRYVYALGPPLAAAAAVGFMRLWGKGSLARLLALALFGWQAALGIRNMADALLWRYR